MLIPDSFPLVINDLNPLNLHLMKLDLPIMIIPPLEQSMIGIPYLNLLSVQLPFMCLI